MHIGVFGFALQEALQRDEVACRDEEREELLHELQQIIDDNLTEQDKRLSQESEEMQQQVKEQIATQLSEESMRMIGLMPRWMPGKMNGKSCNVRYSMPILFP